MIESKFWKNVFFISSYLISLIGFVVIGAWFFKIDSILQVYPGFAPVQFNAALCFFLCGVSLLLAYYKKDKWLKVLGIIIFVISLLTLIQYIFNLNLGIDQLFIKSYLVEKTSHPGRMAPNTAFCFLLFSVFIYFSFKKERYIEWASVFGSVVFGLGLVAFVGYLTGVESTYAWGKFTNMAIITAIGFILLGMSSSIFSIYKIIGNDSVGIEKPESWIIGYCITTALTILLIDAQVPYGVATGVLFSLLVPFGWLFKNEKSPLYLALISTVLCIFNLLIFKEGTDLFVLTLNRTFSIAVIWLFAILLYFIKRNRTKLFSLNNLLNNKITETELKSKELEQFVYTVTHDLKEPLRSVSVLLDVLDAEEIDNSKNERTQLMEMIKSSSSRMGKSIQAILDYAKLGQTFKSEKTDLNLLMKDVLFDLSSITKTKEVDISIDKMPILKIYEEDFRKLMQNLIINAIKYSKPKIECKIKIYSEDEGNFFKFYVQDNGMGIEKSNHERIFKIFQRLQKSDEGLGIGLAHCQKIVNLHKGIIYVESELGLGSTFIFKISKAL